MKSFVQLCAVTCLLASGLAPAAGAVVESAHRAVGVAVKNDRVQRRFTRLRDRLSTQYT